MKTTFLQITWIRKIFLQDGYILVETYTQGTWILTEGNIMFSTDGLNGIFTKYE